LKEKFSFSYFREKFLFSQQNMTKSREIMANSYKKYEKRWLHVLICPLSQLKLKFHLFSQFFCYEKRKFSRKVKTKTLRFNSTENYTPQITMERYSVKTEGPQGPITPLSLITHTQITPLPFSLQ
jgi:hypothetical protein